MNRLSIAWRRTIHLSFALGLALSVAACGSEAPSDGAFESTELALDEAPQVPVEASSNAMCVAVSIGSADLCKPYKFWAKRADQTCADLGLQVADFKPHKRCTKTRFTGADVQCCSAEAQSCQLDMVGSPTACKSDAAWTAIASKACEKKDMSLTQINPGVACGDGNHRFARYECCGVSVTCEEGTHWEDDVAACCPDATWIADCWCEPGWTYTSEEVLDDNGCLLGIG